MHSDVDPKPEVDVDVSGRGGEAIQEEGGGSSEVVGPGSARLPFVFRWLLVSDCVRRQMAVVTRRLS